MVALNLTKLELQSLRLLKRHMPMWFREDSDERGTYEGAARRVVERLIKRGEAHEQGCG
jgi:hypothetical protein